jgi:uncharacterized protein
VRKVEVDYPCDWPYKVIGRNDDRLEGSIHEALVDVEYRLNESKRSSAGSYVSFEVVASVRDERQRYWIYNRLRSLPSVKVVL